MTDTELHAPLGIPIFVKDGNMWLGQVEFHFEARKIFSRERRLKFFTLNLTEIARTPQAIVRGAHD